MKGFNPTAKDLAEILSRDGYGIDTSVTAPGNTSQDATIAAKSARSDEQGEKTTTDTGPTQFEAILTGFCASHGFPPPVFEYKFHPRRKWRADAAIPSIMVLIEMEGGTWTNGRHTRGQGYEDDCEKYNAAALLGWFVLRFTTAMVNDGRMLATLCELPPF